MENTIICRKPLPLIPLFLCTPHPDVQQNLYVCLSVFSVSPEVTKQILVDIQKEKQKNTQKFIWWLYEKLGIFCSVYDGALSETIARSVLNQGEDTSDHFQCLILGFLWGYGYDIPSVQFLREARQTNSNLNASQSVIG